MSRAIEVAKYIINKCTDDNYPISNLQLQKILYYIQRDCLKKGTEAFDDNIEAWQFGPVVPEVYYEFCSYGSMPILMNYQDIHLDLDEFCCDIDKIVEEKRKLEPWDLVEDTHRVGGAWHKTYNTVGSRRVIKTSWIEELD